MIWGSFFIGVGVGAVVGAAIVFVLAGIVISKMPVPNFRR